MATPQRLSDAFEDSKPNGALENSNSEPLTNAPTNGETSVTTPRKSIPKWMRMVNITDATPKREDYLDWDDYFLGIAVLSSQRSKDPEDAEGACIADASNRIVAIGYSGLPRGCPDTVFPWKDSSEESQYLRTKNPYLCTAATNAVLNRGSQDLTGCRLYLTNFPKSDDVKVMIQSGIRELVVLQRTRNAPKHGVDALEDETVDLSTLDEEEQDEYAANIMLTMADIDIRYHRPRKASVELEFGVNFTSTAPPPASAKPCDKELEAATILKEETGYDALEVGVGMNGRREDYLSWEDYFMSVALLTAQRSKDPNTQVGACIVDDQRRIVGLGYNGMPRGLHDDSMPWAKQNKYDVHNKYVYVTHAEVNAILNSKGSYSSHVNGGTLYASLFPCEHCTKKIIQAGIKKVVYLEDKYHTTDGCCASRAMLRCAKVEVQEHQRTMARIDVEYYNEE